MHRVTNKIKVHKMESSPIVKIHWKEYKRMQVYNVCREEKWPGEGSNNEE